jgi:hypothetical protein
MSKSVRDAGRYDKSKSTTVNGGLDDSEVLKIGSSINYFQEVVDKYPPSSQAKSIS